MLQENPLTHSQRQGVNASPMHAWLKKKS